MSTSTSSRGCGSYVAANLFNPDHSQTASQTIPAVTVSRQTGSRGAAVCERLVTILEESNKGGENPWTLYDHDLVRQILRDHNLPEHLAQFMPDGSVSEYQSTINELLGRHPSLWSLYEDSVHTIRRLAHEGHCILVGRGGNFITKAFPQVLKVRIVGSKHRRIQEVMNRANVSTKQAETILRNEDNARASYVRKHYNSDIDEPTHYDLIVNTDHLNDEAAAGLIASALCEKCQQIR
ncbi:AAA family ATPase [Coraliomargarita parva]|uniref:cytidylate kinase-like family protein n=1 Tax=Coraliomargarita parva TaxID=3014050 RepID=UPI0022B5B8F5|nr:cytidylate kinase-like family protein [Coraliomargarita parva]